MQLEDDIGMWVCDSTTIQYKFIQPNFTSSSASLNQLTVLK